MSDALEKPDSPTTGSASAVADLPALSDNLGWTEVWIILLTLAGIGAAIAQFAHGRLGQGSFLQAFALAVCILAAGFDTATSHIPNPITYGAILLGLALNCAAFIAGRAGYPQVVQWFGSAGVSQAFLGFGLCAGIGLACLFTAGMGGGDMKLLAAMGAILGYSRVNGVLIWAMLIAVAYSLLNLIIAGRLNGVLRAAAVQMLEVVYLKQVTPDTAPSKTRIPVAFPLLLGLMAWQITGFAPFYSF